MTAPSLADQIRTRLDRIEADSIEPAAEPFAALRAVLERHSPDSVECCDQCSDFCGEPELWPCYTVQDIALALGFDLTALAAGTGGGDR